MEFKHRIKNAGDGKIYIFEETPLQYYDDLGVDPVSDCESISFVFFKYGDTQPSYTSIPVNSMSALRSSQGYLFDTGLSDIDDGLFTSSVEIAFTDTPTNIEETHSKVTLFYDNIKSTVIHQNKRTDWKEYFGCYTSNLKTALRKEAWLKRLEYAEELGLHQDGERILNSLKKLCY